MANSLIQSALSLPVVPALPWGAAVKPGAALTVPNDAGGIISLNEDGSPIRDGGVDIQGYSTRDRELQWRDIAIAQAIENIARRMATAFGYNVPFARVPGQPVITTPHYSNIATEVPVTVTVTQTMSANGSSKSFTGLTYPILPSKYDDNGETVYYDTITVPGVTTPIYGVKVVVTLQNGYPSFVTDITDDTMRADATNKWWVSYDDGLRRIKSNTTGVPSGDVPEGAITGGAINYERGELTVTIKPCPTQTADIAVTYCYTSILPYSQVVPKGSSAMSWMLTYAPIQRGSVSIEVGGVRVIDDGTGRITSNDFITGGDIDYVLGTLNLRLIPDADNDRALRIGYAQVEYLKKVSADLSATQLSSAIGGSTGVRYVGNASVPQDALISDQDLYRRDLVLYEVLTYADQIFVKLQSAWSDPTASPTIPPKLAGSTTISGDALYDAYGAPMDKWSWAEGQNGFNLPQFGERWGTAVFGDSDRYLAWRDNVLARYAAELSAQLASLVSGSSELQAIATESGQDILVEDGTTTAEEPIPSGAYFESKIKDFYYFDASQSGYVLDTHLAGATSRLALGDVVIWTTGAPSYTITYTGTIFEIIDDRYVKAIPSQTVSQSPTFVRRNLTITAPPRALLVEPFVWKKTLDGILTQFDTANRLLVRVVDDQVSQYLAVDPDATVFAALGDYALGRTPYPPDAPIDTVGKMVHSWNPVAILFLGDNNYYNGAEADFERNNRPYLADIAIRDATDTAAKCFPCFGNHDWTWQTGDPGTGPTGSTSTNTGTSVQINHFHPPGWDTPTNLTGNNGRYYRKTIGPYVEIFCVNGGFNGNNKYAALAAPGLYDGLDPTVTLEPGGIWPGSDQWNWLRGSLAASTAQWKIVFFHYPPYTSHNSGDGHPGYKPMRLPFKEWGATCVMNGDVHAYERLTVDGFTYFVCGIGGENNRNYQKPYAAGSQVRYAETGTTQFGALKVTATAEYMRVECWTIWTTRDKQLADSYTFWAHPAARGQARLEFNEEPLIWSPEINIHRVWKYNDTEYENLGDRAMARVPRHEAEPYLLVSEDNRYRRFAAEPYLETGCRSIVYDKWLRLARFYPHLMQDVADFAIAAPKFLGCRQTQEVQIIADSPRGTDAEYWRQKAAQIQSVPCHERVIEYKSYSQITGIPFGYYHATSTPEIVTVQPAVFTNAGVVRYTAFPVKAISRVPHTQWFQLSFLVEPVRTWYRHANTWSATDSEGLVSVNDSGMTLARPTGPESSPIGAWRLTLPPGSYVVSFDWRDLKSTPAPINVTVRWNGQVISAGTWEAAASDTVEVSDTAIFVFAPENPPNGTDGVLTVQINGPYTAVAEELIVLERFTISRLGSMPVSMDYDLSVEFYDDDPAFSGLAPLPKQYVKFKGVPDLTGVVSTGWIDVEYVGSREELKCELRLVNAPGITLAIKAVEMRTSIKIDPMTDWRGYTNYKDTCLTRAIEGIKARYSLQVWPTEIRTVASTGLVWTAATTAAWLASTAESEPRLKVAFRAAMPGDLGRPALVPSGVYYDGATVISPETMDLATPELVPWQPWMEPLGFPVAMEDFWVVEEPPLPFKLILLDATGEDLNKYDPDAPSLGFDTGDANQYLTLL